MVPFGYGRPVKAYGFEASVVACGCATLLTPGEADAADTMEAWLSEIKMPEGFSPVGLPCPQWDREGGRSILATLETMGIAPELYRVMAKPWLLGLKYVDAAKRTWFYWQPLGDSFQVRTENSFTSTVFGALDSFMDAVHGVQTKAITDDSKTKSSQDQKAPAPGVVPQPLESGTPGTGRKVPGVGA